MKQGKILNNVPFNWRVGDRNYQKFRSWSLSVKSLRVLWIIKHHERVYSKSKLCSLYQYFQIFVII